jgi:hypothetical protein
VAYLDSLVEHFDASDRRAPATKVRSGNNGVRLADPKARRTDARTWRLTAPENFELVTK